MSGKSIRGMLHYNEDKVAIGNATLLLASGFAGNVDEMSIAQKLQRFKNLTELNAAVKTNAIHITLNFDATDKIDNGKLQRIAAEYMERLGFGEQPFLAYRHTDAHHPHLHICTTNIQKDGSRKDIHGIGYRLSNEIRKDLEIKYDLIKAEGRTLKSSLSIKPGIYGEKPTRQTISSIVGAVMRTYHFTSFAEYNAVLKQFNIIADRGGEDTMMFQKRGLQYAILDDKGKPIGIPLKASAIYAKPTLDNLEKKFAPNREKRKSFKDSLKQRIENVLKGYEIVTPERLTEDLQKQQIALVFRRNDQGLIYGVTFIDHRHKTVFNGSDIGKAFSAKAITELLGSTIKLSPEAIEKNSKLHQNGVYLPKPGTAKTYLKAPEPTNFLAAALAKTQGDPGSGVPKRKKRKKRRKNISEQLTF
ncbi:hypothetical protein RG47T_1599 [Mucilaginibacter polytrichastri]|uniref:MobA/VirD2-like nuclease domain-containing protein n=1 Tax=Mucilaginibacter polytrichastri TaxID=1302689 RepID=A0A1Q5ZWK3_9SPHI|nr:hypothetical protein RG47T_1599 [Mucilaginibacter polytrichastri]